jgi:hypothetical protein
VIFKTECGKQSLAAEQRKRYNKLILEIINRDLQLWEQSWKFSITV